MMTHRISPHEESWLLLPWLANGRLSGPERAAVEQHLGSCAECTEELTRQRLMCEVLTEPERVTYAPGPSFRKLMERIDGQPAAPAHPVSAPVRAVSTLPRAPLRGGATVLGSAWRPPGLAWAATVVMAMGLAATTAYQWSRPSYTARSVTVAATPNVLHVAFDRSLALGELEQMLRSAGARVVEGPDTIGIFGVAPLTLVPAQSGQVSPQMRALAARLRADARVRWVEPLAGDATTEGAPESRNGGT